MIRKLLIFPIRIYQRCVSPFLPRCCRYLPTCSSFAVTAIMRFGVIKGMILAVARLLRCHPWARGGIDPVPEEFHWREILSYFKPAYRR